MRIHILGICGTFMGGLAMLARQLGHEVTGSDANVYPPMSTLLEKQGIELIQGYDASQLDPQPDLVIIGKRHDPWKSVCGSGTGKKTSLICQVHSGCTILELRDRWCWPLPVHTAKPPPREWRPGF